MNDRKRVLIADDHQLVRAGLRIMIEQIPGFTVVAEVSDGREAVRLARELQPDIALVDITMPNMNGLEATTGILAASPQTRVIVLTMHANEQYVSEALKAGAVGYLLKDAATNELAEALRTVTEHGHYLSPRVAGQVLNSFARNLRGEPQPAITLTPRQRQILQLIAEGHSTRAIAEQLHISVKTVETHRAQLMERLGIYDVAGLTRYAIRAGLVSADR
jgi:DNA-binding NarL/FixJ family response regulator